MSLKQLFWNEFIFISLPFIIFSFFLLLVVLTVMYRKIQLLQWCMLRANILFVSSMCLIVHRKGNRILKQNFDMAVRVRVSMVNKDERNYVITLDKEKSTCTLVRFFTLPTRLKFNYHQFCFNITRYNHYTFGASSLF